MALSAQLCRLAINLGATAIIARILVPGDFGLVAMVMAVVSFLALFREMGLAAATIQKENLLDAEINTMFWINAAVGCVLTAAVVGLSPLLSLLYRDPRVTPIGMSISVCFLLSGLSVQHRALLRRNLRFGAISLVDVLRPLVSASTGVIAALSGLGVWSLVAMQIAGWSAETLALWIACRWRPGRPRLAKAAGSMVRFGGFLTGFNLLNYFTRNADKMLIGRVCGSTPLGLYAKAYELLSMPLWLVNVPMSSVAVPTLSRLQNDPEKYRQAHGKAMTILAYATTPMTAVLACLATEIVTVLLGDQWVESGLIFRILAVAAIGQPIAGATGWVFVSLRRGRRMFCWALISVPCYVAAFFIGIRWGVLGVAVAYAACEHILRWPLLLYAFHGTPIRMRDLVAACYRPFALSFGALVVMLAIREALVGFTSTGIPLRIVATLAGAAALTGCCLLASRRIRQDIKELADYRHALTGSAS